MTIKTLIFLSFENLKPYLEMLRVNNGNQHYQFFLTESSFYFGKKKAGKIKNIYIYSVIAIVTTKTVFLL